MLTEEQVCLIRESAECLADANIPATNAFYASLFKTEPELRALFPEDMFEQSEKLWASIVLVVQSADDLTGILDALRGLGSRHVAYGAKPAHYPVVTDVLIKTISSIMRDKWSSSHHAAWKSALEAVCETMLEGAAQSAA